MPEVSLERGKFAVLKKFFLRRKSGFHIAGHIFLFWPMQLSALAVRFLAPSP